MRRRHGSGAAGAHRDLDQQNDPVTPQTTRPTPVKNPASHGVGCDPVVQRFYAVLLGRWDLTPLSAVASTQRMPVARSIRISSRYWSGISFRISRASAWIKKRMASSACPGCRPASCRSGRTGGHEAGGGNSPADQEPPAVSIEMCSRTTSPTSGVLRLGVSAGQQVSEGGLAHLRHAPPSSI